MYQRFRISWQQKKLEIDAISDSTISLNLNDDIELDNSSIDQRKLIGSVASSTDKKPVDLIQNSPIVSDLKAQNKSTAPDSLLIIEFNTKNEPTQSVKLKKYEVRHLFFNLNQRKSSLELKSEMYSENLVPKFYRKVIIDDVQYKKYCKMFENKEEKQVMKLMRNYISRITFDQFLSELNRCMSLLEEFLDHNLYTKGPILLCNDKGHSQEWVNKLIYPRLQPVIGERLEMVEIAHPPQRQEKLVNQLLNQLYETGEANHLYFDDCSYSGTQLSKYIQSILVNLEMKLRSIKDKNNSLPLSTKVNLILVVPYMTITAAELIKITLEKHQEFFGSTFGINFKLISSSLIRRIKDLPIDEHNKEVFLKSMDTNENKTLTITDWKMPDYVSVPQFFMKGHTKRSFRDHIEPSPFLSQDELLPRMNLAW